MGRGNHRLYYVDENGVRHTVGTMTDSQYDQTIKNEMDAITQRNVIKQGGTPTIRLNGLKNMNFTEHMAAPPHILRQGSRIVSSIGRSTGRSSASQQTDESEKLTPPQRISQAVRNEERFSISNGRLGSIEFKPTYGEVIGRETYSGKEQTAFLNEFELDKSLMNKLSRVTSKKAAEKLLKEYSGNNSAYGLRETDKHYIFTVNGNDTFALRK